MLLSDHPVFSELATTASDRVLGPHAPGGVGSGNRPGLSRCGDYRCLCVPSSLDGDRGSVGPSLQDKH